MSTTQPGSVERLFSAEEILANAEPFEPWVGIYFLIDGDEIVYVGQSINCMGRVGQHVADKKFSRVAFLECCAEEMDYWESRYILHFAPKYNGRAKGGRLLTPLTRHALGDGPRPRVDHEAKIDAISRLPTIDIDESIEEPS